MTIIKTQLESGSNTNISGIKYVKTSKEYNTSII